ncbi:MAG: PASTA domain-containing protein [Planctomycetes bacterium]|nr:PASTA domain-containing protein [Planctomycetota bacterium]
MTSRTLRAALVATVALAILSTASSTRGQNEPVRGAERSGPGSVRLPPELGNFRLLSGTRSAAEQSADLVVPEASPQLRQILDDWSRSSSQITKLQGEHYRYVYDMVFEVEKHSQGFFYYEAPDRGRIDLQPVDIRPGTPGARKSDKTGEPYKLQSDHAERWICDGEKIWQIEDEKKTADVYPIPEDARGRNIMDGPLPFLFGLPPDKALRRFDFTILPRTTEHEVWLLVKPRLRSDAENWKQARVILDRHTWLPKAVQLLAPSGNEETVYQFKGITIGENKPLISIPWIGGSQKWWDPNLPRSYTIEYHKPTEVRPADNRPNALPSVIGIHGTRAVTMLRQVGCEVELVAGRAAEKADLAHVVYEQRPPAASPLAEGQKVTLTYFVPPESAASGDVPGPVELEPKRTVQNTGGTRGVLPSVVGQHWKKAGAELEAAGYKVEYLKGRAAKQKEQVYRCYEQRPQAGERVPPGATIKLILFTDPGAQK